MENDNVLRPSFRAQTEKEVTPKRIEELRNQHPEGVPLHLLADFLTQMPIIDIAD